LVFFLKGDQFSIGVDKTTQGLY